ncbi:MAG: hypothetical protein JWM82_2193 [Myxococcales bacterium]|nr:hypothetical protein [Myxococcales bacterium]
MGGANDRAVIRSLETGLGRRVGLLVAALVVVAIVVFGVMRGFHGRKISAGADAMIKAPVTAPTKVLTKPAP